MKLRLSTKGETQKVGTKHLVLHRSTDGCRRGQAGRMRSASPGAKVVEATMGLAGTLPRRSTWPRA